MGHDEFLIKGLLLNLSGMPVVTASLFTDTHKTVSANGWNVGYRRKHPESYERIEGGVLRD